jgi:hypothetical protein
VSDLPIPVLSYDETAAAWTVRESFGVETSIGLLVVSAGFVTDLSSIPRWLWWIIAPMELSTVAPIAHDYLYSHGGVVPGFPAVSRAETDRIFYDLMKREDVWWWRRWFAFRAVRLFGRGSGWTVT